MAWNDYLQSRAIDSELRNDFGFAVLAMENDMCMLTRALKRFKETEGIGRTFSKRSRSNLDYFGNIQKIRCQVHRIPEHSMRKMAHVARDQRAERPKHCKNKLRVRS
ncbi:hypothetical protein KIN20_037254 [Parelaphostrongylus tenuis]|uniref:Uncharacterized protein n=1 Tax=Parelaphostrongylus tenuis TaxID=148309 RepID=A0AAD5REF7_PARTN|nr:hypothetical protein KIN20_037254 [Parelaphostrongylus tenuis]